MVYAARQDNQVTLLEIDPDPVIGLAPDIEKPGTVEDVTDLFVLVQMLVEEALHLLFVDVSHLFWGDCDFIPILVVARCSEFINFSLRANVVVQNAQLRQVSWVYRTAGVVWLALVALVQESVM
jgi:hypothetical protein